MTEQESNVIQAAVDVSHWQRALDCGNPAQIQLATAVAALCLEVSALESECDGRWVPPKEGK